MICKPTSIPNYLKRSLVRFYCCAEPKITISISGKESLWARLYDSLPENRRIRVQKILSAILHSKLSRCLAFHARPVGIDKLWLNHHFIIFQRNLPCIKEQGNPKWTKSKLKTVLEFITSPGRNDSLEPTRLCCAKICVFLISVSSLTFLRSFCELF